jgi:hypothetical protein
MAVDEYIIGSEIDQTIKLRKADNSYYDLDNDFANIFVYYSNNLQEVKFSRDELSGHNPLVRIDATTYLIQLKSADTIYLGKGYIEIGINFQETIITGDLIKDNLSNKTIFKLIHKPISNSTA